MKVCDPDDANAANYCQHIFDRIGVSYTCPNQAVSGVFEMCDSENQDFPGIYTSNGQVMTYTQPPESLGPITTMPYTARIPSSSNCVTFKSEDLFASLPTVSAASSSAAATGSASGSSGSAAATGAAGSKGSSGSSASASRTGSASSAAATGNSTQTGAAGSVVAAGAGPASALATIMGVMFAVAFFS
ncbi:hypothetical protein EIP86_004872 [Pleurotus ostreatoroseus]|nr:hypothetical protein EIP86_004872 [Pleurotus ostreatoroseus]